MIEAARIESFIEQRVLALAGASRAGKKFGNTLVKELRIKGFTVYPVHPSAERIDGVVAYSSLQDLPESVGGLVLVVKPEESEKLVREAYDAGITRIWMQQGAESADAVAFCEQHGMEVIHGHCLLLFAKPVTNVHRLHRWLAKTFGKLPT